MSVAAADVGAISAPAKANKTFGKRFGRFAVYACLVLAALVFLIPFASMVFTSLKDMDEIRAGNLLAPPQLITFEPWIKAWSEACISVRCDGLSGYFLNTILIVVPAVLISVGLGALNGYVLTMHRFPGADWVFGAMLFGCFIPFQIVLIPMARMLGLMGLSGSIAGVVFVHVVYGISFTTLFFRNYYQSVPRELVKAANVDGAGFWQTYWHVLLPISWPIITVSVIWQFTSIWNDFLFGVSFASGDNQPVTVGLNNLVNTSTGAKEYNVDMAGAIISAFPTLFVYVVAGRFFLRGLMSGAVKG
ncbi:MAG: carbohydrate ABC transporter permease [Pseudomonadota bacterium]